MTNQIWSQLLCRRLSNWRRWDKRAELQRKLCVLDSVKGHSSWMSAQMFRWSKTFEAMPAVLSRYYDSILGVCVGRQELFSPEDLLFSCIGKWANGANREQKEIRNRLSLNTFQSNWQPIIGSRYGVSFIILWVCIFPPIAFLVETLPEPWKSGCPSTTNDYSCQFSRCRLSSLVQVVRVLPVG